MAEPRTDSRRARGNALIALALAAPLAACGGLPEDLAARTSTAAAGASGTATVTCVIDGDTVVLDGGLGKARLIGIDTPEMVPQQGCRGRYEERECFGTRASQFAQTTLAGHRVRYTVGAEPRDRYGRLLVYLNLNGRSFNARVLREGHGRPLAIRPNTRYAGRYRKLADQARAAGRGLWGACPSA